MESRRFTPSAVSQKIKRLERETGLAMLERVGRGVILTHAARHLVDEGGRLLGDLEALESGLHQQAQMVAGVVRLTSFSTAIRGMVAPLARDLLATYPDLQLSLAEHEPWDTVDLVATGQADVGLVHSWGDVPLSIPDHLVATPAGEGIADLIVHRDHRLAHRTAVTPPDLVREGWIATPEGTICREWLNRMYAGTGQAPRIAHVSMEFDSHLALVRAGLGIALVPRLSRADRPDELVALPAKDPVPMRHLIALHRRTMASSPAISVVVEALKTAVPW